jgi:uncharacterized protein YjbJ (UPF0337 family)
VVPGRLDGSIIQVRGNVKQMLGNIAGPELFAREQMDQRGIFKNVIGDLAQLIPNLGFPVNALYF